MPPSESSLRREGEAEGEVLADGHQVAIAQRASGAVIEPLAVDRVAGRMEAALDQEGAAAPGQPAVGAADARGSIPDQEALVRTGAQGDPAALHCLWQSEGAADREARGRDDLHAGRQLGQN